MQSNEEIIENLTKDLQATSVQNSEKDVISESKLSKLSCDTPSNTTTPVADEEPNKYDDSIKSHNNTKTETIDDVDLVDELSLQDRDTLLSDEEKQKYLEEALKLKIEGNEQFRNKEYLSSLSSYTEALRVCPLNFSNDRSILYANRAASKQKLERKESAIQDCSKALELNNAYIKAYLRRAVLYEETEELDKALEDYKKILEFDRTHKEALSAAARLPSQINKRNEKLEAEMLNEFKDLANVMLRPLGLSTNNFRLNKNETFGSYSVNFVENPPN